MAALTGSKAFGLSMLMLPMLFILLAAYVHAHEEDHVGGEDGFSKSSVGEHVKYGRMTFSEDHEGASSERPTTCTCTCVPRDSSPQAPKPPTSQNSPTDRKRSPPPAPYYAPTPVDNSPSPPTSQNSPTDRKRSPPPAPYYVPTPVYNSPSPPPRSTQSPVTSASPPPPAPYSNVPSYGEPSPAVAAPETIPPPPPTY